MLANQLIDLIRVMALKTIILKLELIDTTESIPFLVEIFKPYYLWSVKVIRWGDTLSWAWFLRPVGGDFVPNVISGPLLKSF